MTGDDIVATRPSGEPTGVKLAAAPRDGGVVDIVSLASLPPTAEERRWVFVTLTVLLVIYGATTPFVNLQFPQSAAILAIIFTLIFTSNLITAVLAFAQCSINRSRALLTLASGYLFSSLVMIPYLLTYPGIFSPRPLLGFNIQGTAFLYNVWHFGFLSTVVGYILLKGARPISARFSICMSVLLTICLICTLAWIIEFHGGAIPAFLHDDSTVTPVARYIAGFYMLIGATALLLLWFYGSSVLDYGLMVVVLAIELELSIVTFLPFNRNSIGVMAVRFYLAVAAIAVLIVLLSENAKLYATVTRANLELRRERDNKMLTLQAMAASIAHEVRQPLTAIVSNGRAALNYLAKSPPDLGEARAILQSIMDDSHRTSDVFDGVRALFGKADQHRLLIDLNDIVLWTLLNLKTELQANGIEVHQALMLGLPPVDGHRGQLREAIFNVVHNAVQAMSGVTDRIRVLRINTGTVGSDAIFVEVEDSGPGIQPDKVTNPFDPFVTTKTDGLGLGLAICRMITEAHGGKVSATNGETGAVFRFVLPISAH